MLSCPFLKNLSPAAIQKDAQQLLNFIPKCPFAKRLFEKVDLTTVRFSTAVGASVERKPSAPNVCKDVSQCLLTECPYNSANIPKNASSPHPMKEEICYSTLKLGATVPQTCALFMGWKASQAKARPASAVHSVSMSPQEGDSKESSYKPGTGFCYSDFFQKEVERKKSDATYRVFKRVLRDANDFPFADDYSTGKQKRVAIWCSNDYLGMSWHPKVKEAAIEAIRKYGVGSGGTRNISGNSMLHEALEAELADLHGKSSALVFTSCYVCNEATLYTLGTRIPNIVILSDAGNHASMIHGIRTSRAPKVIFRHNDVEHLKSVIAGIPKDSPKVVAFETVHSMTGDVCPLSNLLDVCEANGALSFVDEVHAVGLYGEHGAGVAERDGMMHRIDAITGTLGKAFASIGGYLAGSRELVDMIRSYASGFIFTTSLPPPVLAAARASVAILKSGEGQELRAEHQRRVNVVRTRLQDEGLPVIDAPSHILPLHVGEAELCTRISSELLEEHNIYVQSINYPTVDRGDERLRIAPSPHHTDQLTEELVDALCTIWRKYDLPLVNRRSVRSPAV
ncbi:unnamed protein product [Calicophoron daubneyi]|uniref:5-aminolevulinate synthase n=1 Tax=Calicophoron daubneyi TaxID=300641 RepID=A0AAV2TM14_CALDB